MHIHEEVLAAANAVASRRANWEFTADEVVSALRHLNVSSVRTHVGSRCCVNAPRNHLHKWDYFRRIGRGKYQVLPGYRRKVAKAAPAAAERMSSGLRDTIHLVVSKDGDIYVGECVELPVVTQAQTLDGLVANVREALALHLEDEDPADYGLQPRPRLQFMYELTRAV